MLNPKKKYNLEYYVSVVDKIVAMGAHVLGIKDSQFPPPLLRSPFLVLLAPETSTLNCISHQLLTFLSGWCS
jgi:hypothetical protein